MPELPPLIFAASYFNADIVFINSSVGGHLLCCRFWAARSEAGVNSCAQIFVWVWFLFISFGDKPRSEWLTWQLHVGLIILNLVFYIEDDDAMAGRWRSEDSCRELVLSFNHGIWDSTQLARLGQYVNMCGPLAFYW